MRRQIADKIFFPKKIAQVSGIEPFDFVVPRRHDGDEERNAKMEPEFAQQKLFATNEQVGEHSHARQNDTDRSFYECGGSQGDVHQTEP